VSALDVEPQLPACHLCGSTAGPWLPDPEADRWPSGAQRLICSRRCAGEPLAVEGDDVLVLLADPDRPVPYAVAPAVCGAPEATAPAVLDLLSVIRDMADVPLPSLDDADERAWRTLMLRRLGDVHVVLSVALSPKWSGMFDAAREAAVLRQRLNATPVTYTRYGREGAR
jgi:hypothetical protein